MSDAASEIQRMLVDLAIDNASGPAQASALLLGAAARLIFDHLQPKEALSVFEAAMAGARAGYAETMN